MVVNVQKYFGILFILLSLSYTIKGQESLDFELVYQINRVYPPLALTKAQIKKAKSIEDMNPFYKRSWVKEFKSVVVSTLRDGKIIWEEGDNDIFTQEQKNIITLADVASDISIVVKYLPDNTLSHNDVKTIDFTFTIEPVNCAKFSGTEAMLQAYLKEHAIDKVPLSTFKQYNLTAVSFVINEEGQIVDAHISDSSNDEKVDSVLLNAICKMPKWEPAIYHDGTRIQQEFVFMVGDETSCTSNLYNTRTVLSRLEELK